MSQKTADFGLSKVICQSVINYALFVFGHLPAGLSGGAIESWDYKVCTAEHNFIKMKVYTKNQLAEITAPKIPLKKVTLKKTKKAPLKIKIAGIKTQPYVKHETPQKLTISGLRSKPFVKKQKASKQQLLSNRETEEIKERKQEPDQATDDNQIKLDFVQSYFGEKLPFDFLNIVRSLTTTEVQTFLRTDKKVYWMGDHFKIFNQEDVDYLESF